VRAAQRERLSAYGETKQKLARFRSQVAALGPKDKSQLRELLRVGKDEALADAELLVFAAFVVDALATSRRALKPSARR
jgi:hypothetical protein